MPIHVYVFLLVVCLLFCLPPLWRHDWLHLQLAPHEEEPSVARSTVC